jgi:mannose/fructose/N-acetylgalactosamine-specific phosphotransferase system component IID
MARFEDVLHNVIHNIFNSVACNLLCLVDVKVIFFFLRETVKNRIIILSYFHVL